MKIPLLSKDFRFPFDHITVLACLVMPIIQYGLAHVSIYLSDTNGASAIWPTSGFYLAALLIFRWRIFPAIFLAELVGNSLFYETTSAIISIALVDTTEILIIGFLIQYWIGHHHFFKCAQDLFKFLAIALGIILISSALAASVLCLHSIAAWSDFLATWRLWYISVVGGITIVTPALLSWLSWSNQQRWRVGKIGEFALLLGVTIGISYISFWQEYALEYTTLPLLMWCAFQFRQRESTLLVLVIDGIAIFATRQGFGPFVREDLSQSLLLLQSFILVVGLTGYLLCAVVNENRQAALELTKNNNELERRVAERTAELAIAKEKAESANQAKSAFIANMSHELRTPLNGILGYAQILQRNEPLTTKGKNGVDIIYQCGSHLLTLINDVLDLSKIEARKLELHPVPFHLLSFLQSIVEITRIRAEQKGIDFQFQADDHLPVGVSADEKRLRQVLINLLGNAIKFTDRGSVIFKIESIGQKIRFQIEDTGVGMTPEQIEKIFLPFEQVGNRKKQAEGTGLGLAITKKIIAMMKSEIEVSSTLTQGSTFSFTVELTPADNWATASRVSRQGEIVGYQGQKRKILIIDDRWANRSVLLNLLEPIGFEIVEASNGQEGIEQTLTMNPDLIITDLAMPIMDGFEFLRQLRSHPQIQHKIALVSSASVFDLDRHKSLEAGGSDFLPKPVQADTLLERLHKHLQLDWIYNENENKQSEISAATTIEPPDTVILTQLAEFTDTGDLDGVLELARDNQTTRAAAFFQKIILLAEAYEIKQLRVFIQQYLTPH